MDKKTIHDSRHCTHISIYDFRAKYLNIKHLHSQVHIHFSIVIKAAFMFVNPLIVLVKDEKYVGEAYK